MMIHMFLFKWHANATSADKARAVRDIAAFQGVIEGLLETHVGENVSPRSRGYAFAGVMKFTDDAAFNAYMVHPAHQALIAWLGALIEPVEADFPI